MCHRCCRAVATATAAQKQFGDMVKQNEQIDTRLNAILQQWINNSLLWANYNVM